MSNFNCEGLGYNKNRLNRVKCLPLKEKNSEFFVSHVQCLKGYLSDDDCQINYNYLFSRLYNLEKKANESQRKQIALIRARLFSAYSKPLTKAKKFMLSNTLNQIVKLITQIE